MFRIAIVSALFAMTACVADEVSSTDQDLDPLNDNGGGEPHDAKVFPARGQAGGGGGGGSPNLIYHGGPVMTSPTAVQPIYWGSRWSSATFVGDKMSGLSSFYAGANGTSYMGTNSEYTDSSGAHVSTGTSVASSAVDTSTAPKNGGRTSVILAEVCKLFPHPAANTYFPVYIDNPRNHSGYCAWHSTGTCNGTRIQFGFFYNLDGDPGCDPQDSSTTHSQGLAALANVSGHEMSEMVTDKELNAWYDSSGAENSDKCAWTFSGKRVTFNNNTTWKIQGNWSNNAYNTSSGYDGAGCVDGQ